MTTTEVKTSFLSFHVTGGNETLSADGSFELRADDDFSLYLNIKKVAPEPTDVGYASVCKQTSGEISYSYNLREESVKAQVYAVVDKVYTEAKAKIDELKPKLVLQ